MVRILSVFVKNEIFGVLLVLFGAERIYGVFFAGGARWNETTDDGENDREGDEEDGIV